MFLLRDEHTRDKLTLTGLETSRNWPQILYGKRPKAFAKKRMSKVMKKGIYKKNKKKQKKPQQHLCHDFEIYMVDNDVRVVT